MILQIRQFESQKEDSDPEHVVECDRYTIQQFDEALRGVVSGVNARYFWKSGDPDQKISRELILFSKDRVSQQIFLMNAVVYVMNNEGKTIDTIYAI